MISINRIPPEQMIEAHARAEGKASPVRRRPPPVNISAARQVTAPESLSFRGKTYPARHVPFEIGLDLLELASDMEQEAESGEGTPRERMMNLRRSVNRVVDLCWEVQRPAWYPRILWRMRRNPFRSASLDEVRVILGFTGQRQTI